jgi:large conductance mechanosensitive channel
MRRGGIVQSFVKAFVTPLIGAFGSIPDFSAWAFTVNNSRFAIGEFINALISFVIMATVVYFFVVMPVNRLMDRYKPEEPPAKKTRECPECESKIPESARRCAFCTAEVRPVATAVSILTSTTD